MNHKWSTLLMPATVLVALAAGAQTSWSQSGIVQDQNRIKAAQSFRKANQPVAPVSDTTVIAEAEEFQVAPLTQRRVRPKWQALPWGANYYAATFANSFLSRKAFLGAPEQADGTTATIQVQVPKAGRYLALVRYEAAPRFETQFRLVVEQNGKRLDRLYGARDNLKIWAFREQLKKEVSWSWGAVENVVWEGHDAYVDLQAGPATLTLIADKQPEPGARRNVDLVMLTSDEEQVKTRIATENYLPLDGMLTQEGDVYLKVHNAANGSPMTLTVSSGTEHSPYWVHIRNWKPKSIAAKPGESTDWVEVGSLLDSLNDGQWSLPAKGEGALNYSLEFGVRGADGKITAIKRFDNLTGNADLAYHADTRYSHLIRTSDELLYDLVDYLKKQPAPGVAPKRTLVYGYTFRPKAGNAKYNAALMEFFHLMGANALNQGAVEDITTNAMRGYIDVRGQTPQQLEALGQKLQAEGKADKIAVVSLGDEIGLSSPPAGDQTGFHTWLQQRGLKPSDVDPTAGDDWGKVIFNPSVDRTANPRLFYYSNLYSYHYGIQAQKAMTDVLRKYLPNAGIGANYSPHGAAPFLGDVHQWVTLFREGGMTMPWGEDYIWQIPIGSQQMNFLGLDLFRAGIKGKPDAKILFYVMPHTPGNTVNSWRRQFYGDLGHGMKIVNLFEFDPVQAAYTENHTSWPEMYQEVRRSLHELGQFEDIIQDGQVRPGVTALWFSETGDLWGDNRHPFSANKRSLYVAIRHQQLPLDVVVEQDALAGDLKNYKVLYLTDQHVSRAASKAIADWVNAGGRLFVTAGGGMFDEFNQPNTIMRDLLGVNQTELVEGADPVRREKEDLPFAKPIDTVTWKAPNGEMKMPVIDVRSRFNIMVGGFNSAEVQATFADGSPAVTIRKAGQGTANYTGFLAGLSYFKPAIPLRPADRGSTDDSMAHFIPTNFDRGTSVLIGSIADGIERPVVSSNPLVETSIVQSKQGVVIPLTNWSNAPVKNLTIGIGKEIGGQKVTLASGKPVKPGPVTGTGRSYIFDLDVADALILR